jgi:hypothetical protein
VIPAYKLLRVRKDGTLGSLFIDRRAVLPVGKWLPAKRRPTAGFKVREGWHALPSAYAPHLGRRWERRWFKVQLAGKITRVQRPLRQGGEWLLAERMRILEPAT